MSDEQPITTIERPHRSLWRYYLMSALVTGPLLPFVILPFWFRYHTMRYRFGEEGVSMRWGILFRKEINLTYARIQDIHLVSNFVERWLGLARIQIQTASGSAKAEMTIEGILEYEQLRDFLYSRMRGARGMRDPGAGASRETGAGGEAAAVASSTPGLAELLDQTAGELGAIRRLLEQREEREGDDG
jgi:membrane protein YdbS with pleckstrin-like domain